MRPDVLALILAAGCTTARPPETPPPDESPPASRRDVPVAEDPIVESPPRASIHAGSCHTCRLDVEGRLACWGCNDHGQLGDGTTEDRARPMPVEGLPPIAAVDLGSSQTCAIDREGKVWCWGLGDRDPSGRGADVTRPHEHASIDDATHISVGRTSACATTASGALWCWGSDRYRDFGGLTGSSWPERVDRALEMNAIDVHAGGEDVCALDDRGAVHCWGENLGNWDAPPPGSSATNEERQRWFRAQGGPIIKATDVHGFVEDARPICVWTGDEDARTWTCLTHSSRAWPKDPSVPIEPRARWPQLAYSGAHGCFADEGRVRCWGENDEHQADPSVTAPLRGVVQVATGGAHSCGLHDDGAITCWGSALHFATGDETMVAASTPPAAPSDAARRTVALKDVTQIEASNTGLPCAVVTGGTVRCLDEDRWVRVPGLRGIVELSNGDTHACARDSAGAVHCWGQWYFGPYNHDGADGDWLNVRRPRRIRVKARAIESWGETDCALTRGGAVRCWGRDGADSLVPQHQFDAARWVDIAMSERWHCGLEASGRARCWAAFADMDGDPEFESSDVAEISVTGDRGCARRRDGTVLCWGSGPVGDGSWQERVEPALVRGLSGVTAVSAGVDHSCARTEDGRVWCWGDNDDGQLGDGTSGAGLEPIAVAGDLGTLAGVTTFAWRPYRTTLNNHAATFVWAEGGEVWMWGASP